MQMYAQFLYPSMIQSTDNINDRNAKVVHLIFIEFDST